jgi:hypothetical protein
MLAEAGRPQTANEGTTMAQILATHAVEKGKPLATSLPYCLVCVHRSIMVVAVVTVVDVWVLMLERPGRMRVHVRLRSFPTFMFVLVVLVMDVAVRVRPCLVPMPVGVPLAQQQPNSARHQGGRQGQRDRHGFTE